MKRPDHTFHITVNPVSYIKSCPGKLEEESRGMMGFHGFEKCSECQKIDAGFEFWGENGHRCGSSDRAGLAHWLKRKAQQQWRSTTDREYPKGSLIGYSFKLGGRVYYRAN